MRLRDDLHWCLCGDRVIFLDLVADRYLCLPAGLEAPFLGAIEGDCAGADRQKLQGLIDRGFLVEAEGGGAVSPKHRRLPKPVADMFTEGEWRARAADLARALALDLWATRQLRTNKLLSVARDVARRSESLRPFAGAIEEGLGRIVAAFAAIGVVLRTADRCLARALAVHAACCRSGIRAELVIGVQLHPFQAHAWVQIDDKVLVGDFEQVRLFTPIAALG